MIIYEEVRHGAARPASHAEEDGPIVVVGGAGSGKSISCSPQHRVNPLDRLTSDSPSLIADAQKSSLDFCPAPGGVKNAWFSDHARRWVSDPHSARCGAARRRSSF